jgi:BlaI family transcriptional regulator, penicillinase repressor
MELTNAEEQIMQVLWKIEKGFVKDILEHFNDPKPAYNTISTVVRILEKKELVSHKAYGNSHQYYPLISKKEYSKSHLNRFAINYFGNSIKDLVSFFSESNKLSILEIDETIKLLNELKNKKS